MKTRQLLRKACLAFSLLLLIGHLSAQSGFFSPVADDALPKAVDVVENINSLSVLRLDETALREYLSNAPVEFQNNGNTLSLEIPLPDGRVETFGLVESSILSPEVAAQHPEIKSYTGNGLNYQTAVIRVTLTSAGFHAVILDLAGEEIYFEHYSLDDKDVYFNYFVRDAVSPPDYERGRCMIEGAVHDRDHNHTGAQRNNTGGSLRTFRLALAANGEFTQQNGGTQASAFAEVVNYVATMNLVYRRELSVNYILVSGLNLIYDNPGTDPYTNDLDLDLDINQTNCDAVIGNANYDIGHMLGYSGPNSGGGLASFQSVCDDATKAQGGSNIGGGPYSQVFFDQLLLHETGHQFGMNHTYNSVIPVCTTRNPSTSAEPGAGATIMSYGFTCDTDDYFTSTTSGPFLNYHTVSYAQADAYIGTISCQMSTATGNNPPVVTMPSAFTIPRSTPFFLTGSADAPEMGDAYTYSWEGTDIGAVVPDATTLDDTSQPPFFRSYAPSTSPTRTFPILSAILDGTNQAKGDKLPSVSFPTMHRLTVRDNNAAGGGLSYGEVTITVDGNTGPFLETTNLAATYPAGSMQNITWSVNGTNTATPTVNILLSVDGGLTFPYTLATATGNDGNEMVTLPNVQTSTARIKVEAVGNIFFDISNFDFSIDIPGCTAVNSNICPTDAMTFDQGDAGLNLNLSNTFGNAVTQTSITTTNASPSGELANATTSGGSTCQTGWGVERYTTFDFSVATTGTYTFTQQDAQFYAFSIFVAAGYDPAMPCAGTFLGSNSSGFISAGSSTTVTLTACTTYKLVAWEVNDDNISSVITFTGPGTVYSTIPSPADAGYTYIAVNTANDLIAAQSATADFTTLAAGTYMIYGASYKDGGPTPPADVDPATWIGSTLSAVQSADCVVFSTNFKPLTINAGACPDLTAAPANVTITNSACGTGCATTPGNIAAPASPCPVGSTLQYSTDNGVTFSTTLPIYDEVNPITVTTRCSCDADPTMTSPSSAAVTTAPAPCVDPVFTPALVQPTCMADGNITFSGAGLTFEQSTDGATFTPAASPIVLAQGEQPAVTYTIRATDANGCTTDETINVAAVTNCITCPDLTAAPANVTITNSACGTGCATTPGNIAAPASPCPVGSTLQYSTDNGVTFSTTLPIYDEVNPITIATRCSCDADPTMTSPSSAAVTTAPAPCVDPVFTPALVQPTCMADGNITFSGAGLTFEQSTDGATFTPAASPIVLAQGEQPAVTYTIRATDANGCTTDETINVAAVTNCITCPDLTAAPANVTITNSACGTGCATTPGNIAAPASPCPVGSTLQYSTDNGVTFSTTLPIYDEVNPITVTTRCSCDADPTMTSPSSAAVTTAPAPCVDPVFTPALVQPTCMADGNITFSGAGLTFEQSTDGATFTPAASPIVLAQGEQPAVTYTIRATDANGCTTDETVNVAAVTNCITCPDLTAAPANVTITNSSCGTGCATTPGNIAAPASPCPVGSTLQYSTDNGVTFSTTLPIYDEVNPITITTRCSCDADPTMTSPSSAAVTTAPAPCVDPVFTPALVQPTCMADGNITFSGAGLTFEQSTDGATFTPATSPIVLAQGEQPAVTYTIRATDANGCTTDETINVAAVTNCITCPDLTAAPANVTITNSACGTGCATTPGNIAAPASPCPVGSTLQYSTDNGVTFSTTLPIYDEVNPITVTTRCSCDADPTMTSPSSAAVTTAPAPCVDPVFTPALVQPTCMADGNITFSGAGLTFEQSTDGATFTPATSPIVLAQGEQPAVTYTIRATDANGCTTDETVNVAAVTNCDPLPMDCMIQFEQPSNAPNLDNAYSFAIFNLSDRSVMDNFSVPVGTGWAIQYVEIVFARSFSPFLMPDFDIMLRADNAGTPGADLQSFMVLAADVIDLGEVSTSFGLSWHRVQIPLAGVLPLAGGLDYWVEFNAMTATNDNFFIEVDETDNPNNGELWVDYNDFNGLAPGSQSGAFGTQMADLIFSLCIGEGVAPSPTVDCGDGTDTIFVDASCMIEIPDYTAVATATDADMVRQEPEAGQLVGLGSTTVLVIAENGTGADTCEFVVTVEDNTMPDAQCQDVTVQLDANGNGSITAADLDGGSTDNCTITSLSASATAFDCDDLVGSVVAYGGTLATGNSNVNAPTSPTGMDFTVTDPAGIVVTHLGAFDDDLDGIAGSIEVRIYRIDSPTTGTIVVGPLTFTGSADPLLSLHRMQALGTAVTLPPGQYSIVADGFTNTDLAGNASIAGGVVTTTNGSGVMTFDRSRFGGPGVTGFPTTSFPTPSVWHAGTFQYEVAGGINTVTLTVTDQSGNSTTCDATVTVADTISPTLECSPITVFLDENGMAMIENDTALDTLFDNCDMDPSGPFTVGGPNARTFDCSFADSTFTRTVVASDMSDNQGSCIYEVTVLDTIPPTLECSAITVFLDENGMAMIENDTALDTLFDNCDMDPSGPFTVGGPNARTFDCSFVDSTFTRTVVATDMSDNQGSCVYEVTVLDTIPPTLECSPITVFLDENGMAMIENDTALDTLFDNCDMDPSGPFTVGGPNARTFDCSFADSTFTRTVVATDMSGNQGSCIYEVTVIDTIAPVIVCRDTIVQLDALGAASVNELDLFEAEDACGVDLSDNDNPIDLACADVNNPIDLDITVVDNNGNDTTCTVTITVFDTIRPVITTFPQTVTLNDNGVATIDPDAAATATDACGIASLVVTQLTFSCEDVIEGVVMVPVIAVDVNDNETIDSVAVTVLFNEPELGCISSINVTLNENCQAMLVPEMVLAGNTVCLTDLYTFNIVVMDDDPSNGPIIDGCGTFQYTITEPEPIAAPTAPDPIVGFTGAFAEANWTVVTDLGGDPGDVATVDFTSTTLVLNTNSNNGNGANPTNTPSAEASYMFSQTGTLTFDYAYVTDDGGFDAFIIDFEGTMTPVDITGDVSTNGDVTASINPGDMLVVRVSENDGLLSGINQLTISNFLFTFPTPVDNQFNLDNFSTCWGFVNAEDKTSPRITDSIVAPDELFCVDLATINLNGLGANVSRCFQVDAAGVPTQANFYQTALGRRLAMGSATGVIPGFFDGCSAMEICVNDLVPATDDCDDVVITRVFTATDGECPSVSGEGNAPTVFSYQIIFTRPDVDSVQSSATLAEFSCSDVLTLLPINQFGNQNPVPAVEDYPFVVRADGTPIFLDETFCNLGATFEDGPRIVTCANTYKFVRTWTVIDWCEVSNIRTFTQLVKVGDFDAPVITPPTQDLNFDGIADAYPLFYSTNTSDCRSIFVIPAGSATDACDNSPTVSAVIYPFGDTLALGFGPYAVGSPTFDGIPRGTHTIRYTASDDCGNESILDVPVTIGDATAPVAICEDGLNISIGGPIGPQGGSAQLCADDIDRASYDDCSDVALRISRVDAENRPIDANGNLVIPAQNAYVNCITLTCADLGNVRVSLRVTDDGNDDGLFEFGIDNSNFCWLDVLVEDKTAPICIAPAPQTINCNDLSGEFPDDLNLAVATDPEGTFALLNDQFGTATGLDNCPDPVVTQSVVDNRNSCGVGTIVRTFTVTDGEGFTSPPNCGQLITVQAVHDYTVVFPGDQESDQCIEPDYNAVTYTEFGCDLLTVSTSIDTFSATADECYKLRITYEVLNWCEYNTLDAPYMIPRDADNDGILDMDTTVLHVVPRNAGLGDDLAYLDRDVNRANFNTIANLDNGDPNGILPGSETAGYGNDGSRGAFLYQQFIKVYDDTPPTLVVTEPDSAFCSFAADCTGDVELTYAIDDECSPASVDATVELDAFVNPGADGVYTLADFVADGGDVTSLVTDNEDGTFTVNLDDLPIGEHAIRIRVTDGCGNVAVDLIEFEVVDCKAPTPICINGLTVTLMPDGTGGGMAAIWVSDFIASPSTDCSGPVEFAIYLDGEQPAVPSGLDTGLVLDCSLVGPQTIRIYAIDQEGNADYCLTTLMVQVFNSDVCTGPGSDGSLAGTVISTMDEMMDAVEVNLSGQNGMTDTELTTNGLYQFTGLALGDDYTVEPTHDPSINLARVSTGDIILISRHILGLQEMTGTYQLKAGDVTQDDNLNILDIIAIRRVILGLDLSFSATNSWRFYVAGDDQFAETYTENNLAGAVSAPDFIAVEMGNVTDAANAFTGSAEDGGRSLKTINIEEQQLETGNTYAVTLRAGELAGFQGTLQLGSGLELTNVNYAALQAGNVNLSKVSEGLIAFSYESKEAAGTELLTLEVRATVNAQLSELLSLTDRITRSEAYTTTDELARLGLDFTTTATAGEVKFALEQNSPNPFVDQTQVRFTLPNAATVQLTIQNQQGQLLRTMEIDAAAGANQITVGREQLNGATGVLTYTLVTGEFVATRKMIVQ